MSLFCVRGVLLLAGELVAPQIQAVLLAGVCGAGGVFAARKYSQPIKDDIGDKSVFMWVKCQWFHVGASGALQQHSNVGGHWAAGITAIGSL